ncbi:MAG: ATP-binding cassette domain-containing protein, partial [Eubacterium sp.]
MIKVAHLSKTFRHGLIKEKVIKAVDDVSFSIEGGQTLGLVGMSGCGKSTLSRMILKLISSDTGSITFKNINITDYSFKQMKPLRRDMQILFQHPDSSLNPRMIIGKSMLEPFKLNPDLNRSKASEAIEEQLLFVGLN